MYLDNIRGLMGRISSRERTFDGLRAALHIIEALWCNMKPEERERARRWTGFDTWLEAIKRAVDWA